MFCQGENKWNGSGNGDDTGKWKRAACSTTKLRKHNRHPLTKAFYTIYLYACGDDNGISNIVVEMKKEGEITQIVLCLELTISVKHTLILFHRYIKL